MKDIYCWVSVLFLVIGAFVGQSRAQTTPPSITCQPNSGITDVPHCDFIYEKLVQCNTSLPLPQRQACYCTQEVFDALFDCKSEWRLCQENDNYDNSVDNAIDNWHLECDSFVSSEASKFTTPTVSSLTATFDVLKCQSIGQSCQQANQASTACSTKYTVGVAFQSCLCQASILSLASVCEYDGNVTCKLTTANIQNVYGWGTCSGYQTILTAPGSQISGTIVTATTSSSSSGSSLASLTITQPPFTSASTAQSSSSSRSEAPKKRLSGEWKITTMICISFAIIFA